MGIRTVSITGGVFSKNRRQQCYPIASYALKPSETIPVATRPHISRNQRVFANRRRRVRRAIVCGRRAVTARHRASRDRHIFWLLAVSHREFAIVADQSLG